MTQKKADFELFKQIVELISDKKHLSKEGVKELLSIRASMNLGLSDSFKEAFPDITPVRRPVVPLVEQFSNIDPNWMLGFSEGESCFFIGVNKSNCTKSGYQVQLKFLISQNLRDAELLKLFIDFFNCGKF